MARDVAGRVLEDDDPGLSAPASARDARCDRARCSSAAVSGVDGEPDLPGPARQVAVAHRVVERVPGARGRDATPMGNGAAAAAVAAAGST
jgi:hypothetical protein